MLELYTFRVSHFSEKIRWCLDASGIEYHETRWTPFFHVVPALRFGRRGTTVPILRTPSGHVQDSTRILRWLDVNLPGFDLVPRGKDGRRDAFDIEERFDRVGPHVTRYCYSVMLDDIESTTAAWSTDAGFFQKQFIRGSYPLLRTIFRRQLGMSQASVERSHKAIGDALDFIDERLASRRSPFLAGGQLSIADITAASLLAPLFGPPQHPLWSNANYRELLDPLVRRWRGRPAGQWVLRMYAEHRGAWRNPPPEPVAGP